MRYIFVILFALSFKLSFGQNLSFKKDSLLIIKKDAKKGFNSDYILFIPKGTLINKTTFLLIEPNNTGKTSDSMSVHKEYAIDLASKSSVGNNVSTMLKIPLLVPIFPRPSSKPLTYSHALDKNVMQENSPDLKRLDLQLLAMVNDAKTILKSMHIKTHSKILLNGFSASATFVNRFSVVHPETIKALAIGGFNGKLILPINKIKETTLNYPIGINNLSAVFNKKFEIEQYRKIPQFIYMGKLDENDAVQYDDAYDENERQIINSTIGSNVQERYLECQRIYKENAITPIFKSYEKVGHWTTSDINLAVIQFFFKQIQDH